MAEFIVAVTGGIASGKSAITGFFNDLGIGIADADLAARTIVEPGQAALEEIAACFGSGLVVSGHLDRRALRELIFENTDARKKLESITHPRIRELLAQQCKSIQSPYAIVAIPLLRESDRTNYDWIKRILVVDVPRATQKSRLLARDNISESLAEKMLDGQATRAERLAIANDVISNVHDLASLRESVNRLDSIYRQIAKAWLAKSC